MRKLQLAALFAVIGALALSVQIASAGNAHFIGSQTGAFVDQTGADAGTLVCFFKEAGLESGSVETITCNADASTTYQCVNNGGKNPNASNKTTTQSHVAPTGTFPAAKNGNVVGDLRAAPPTAQQLGFSCPSGQRVEFVSVTYSNISIVDSTSGASQPISGTLSYTNPNAATS
jgi:hypothetical protein